MEQKQRTMLLREKSIEPGAPASAD